MDRKVISFVAGAAAIAVVVIAGAAYFGQPDASNVGGAPAPSPTPTPELRRAVCAASFVTPGITGWTPYTSAVYGFTMSYPSDWSVDDPASHKWQPGQPDDADSGVVGHLRERRCHRWRFHRHACVPGACPKRGRPGVLGRPASRAPELCDEPNIPACPADYTPTPMCVGRIARRPSSRSTVKTRCQWPSSAIPRRASSP